MINVRHKEQSDCSERAGIGAAMEQQMVLLGDRSSPGLLPREGLTFVGQTQCGKASRFDRETDVSTPQLRQKRSENRTDPDEIELREARRRFIGGSDAPIIMGKDEDLLVALWKEKRGEAEPPDFSGNLPVQLGRVTEGLNRRWYERHSGHSVRDVQKRVHHPVHKWMAATLDGIVEPTGAVFEAKFMLPWSFSEETAAVKHMAQLQHNMWVVQTKSAVLSIITGGGKWVELTVDADPLYQHLLLTAEKKFWRCVQEGRSPRMFGIELPKPNLGTLRIVDMSTSNAWAEQAAIYRRTRAAYVEHDDARGELKNLMPADAKQAIGHGLRARRSKSGAVSFEAVEMGQGDAARQ